MDSLKVCIDARLVSGNSGGVEQFVIGLATGLSTFVDGSEEYLFLAYDDEKDWLLPYLNGSCRILDAGKAPVEPLGKRWLKQLFPFISQAWQSLDPLIFRSEITQKKSNGIIENEGVNVMHFTYQNAFLTDIPNIYHPHDLQHIHLPELFSARLRVMRDQMLRAFCEQANMVAVVSSFVKNDLMKHYPLADGKIKVVPLAPVVSAYAMPSPEKMSDIQQKFSLPDDFIFYPAQTWPHKNHVGLLRALALIRDELDTNIKAVFSGRKNQFYDEIAVVVRQLGLENQVFFLGFVSPEELRGLYGLSKGVVIPTRFEAASFPLWEAYKMEVPVACSSVTSLPDQAGDAALLFDPHNPRDIAMQLYRLWTDEEKRADLIEKGRKNVLRFSWRQTAKIFRAHYRCISERTLTEEDKVLLSSPPIF